MVTPGIICYLDFNEAEADGTKYTFLENVEKKLSQSSQCWLLNVPQSGGITSGPATWNSSKEIRVNGVSGYFTVAKNVVTQVL